MLQRAAWMLALPLAAVPPAASAASSMDARAGSGAREVASTAARARVHAEVREMMRANEGRVLFSDLWNGDRLDALEKEYAARLYEVFFALPALVADELRSQGAPPARAAIADSYGLSPEAVDLLLGVMTGEPRMPKLFRRQAETGEIVDVDRAALEAFVKSRGSQVRVSGWQGAPLPSFSLAGVPSGTLSSHSLDGRPGLVFLWLTRCPVCRRVTPSVVELSRRLGPRGLQVVGLNADEVLGLSVTPAERESWLREQGVSYPNAALDAATRAALGQNIFPAFFLVERDGRVRELVLNERSLEELEALVEPLLDASAASP